DNSGIVLFDSKGTRLSDDQEIWQMEVAGPPWNPTTTHTINDTKKTFQSDILNLVSILRNNLDCSIDLATKIKVFCTQAISTRLTLYALNMLPDGRFLATELASAIIPFSWSGRGAYQTGRINGGNQLMFIINKWNNSSSSIEIASRGVKIF
ncbi:1096_t:CDS:2, partial [Entrophospora sp. SA101]